MTATTPNWGLRYPNDYNQPADSPNAFQQLAMDTDGALGAAVTSSFVVAWSGYERNEDVALTADAQWKALFTAAVWRFPGTIPAVSADTSAGYSVLTIIEPGMYQVDTEFSVLHATIGTKKTFQMGMTRTGTHAGEHTIAIGNEQITPTWPHRLKWNSVMDFAAGDRFHVFLRPVGSTATGWSMTYARTALTRIR